MWCGRRVRVRETRSDATESTYNPARLEALFKHSVVLISQSFQLTRSTSLQNFLRIVGVSVNDVLSISFEISCLFHATVNLFHFEKIDQL